MTDPSGPENDAEGPFPIDPRDLLRHARAIANALPGRGDARAAPVARAALFLQSERVHADYNHRERFTRQRTQDDIDTADRAVEALEGGGGEALVRLLAAMLDAP